MPQTASSSSEIGKDGEDVDLLRKTFHRRDFFFTFNLEEYLNLFTPETKTKAHCKEQAKPRNCLKKKLRRANVCLGFFTM